MTDLLSRLGINLSPPSPDLSAGLPPPGSNAGGTSSALLQGQPLLNITTSPQQVPIGQGATIVNTGSVAVLLSQDAIVTSANSYPIQPNGASIPIKKGPLWASVTGTTSGQLLVIPEILNIFNPNVLASTSAAVQIFNQAVPIVGGDINIASIPIPLNLRTLIVYVNDGATVHPTISVIGNVTNVSYFNSGTYLSFSAVFPILAGIDSSIQLAATGLAAFPTAQVTVWGDFTEYDESIFYNGNASAAEAGGITNGTYIILTGPARLLTAEVYSQVGATGGMRINGQTFLQHASDSSSPGPNNSAISVSFPPNTLLSVGSTLDFVVVNAGGAAETLGSVTFAYP